MEDLVIITTTANMDNITPINTSYPHLRQVDKRKFLLAKLFALLVLLVSSSLFFIALSQVRATLNHVPVNFAVTSINNKKRLDTAPLNHIIDLAKNSINIDNNPHYSEDLTTLLFYQAQKQGIFGKSGVNTLKQAKQSAESALSEAPANAYLWYQLATINLLLGESPEKIAKTLLMSIMTGPSESAFLIPRLNLCLMIFSTFSKDDHDMLRTQVLNAWTLSHKYFLELCAYNKERIVLISQLLENKNPDELNNIISAFEKSHK